MNLRYYFLGSCFVVTFLVLYFMSDALLIEAGLKKSASQGSRHPPSISQALNSTAGPQNIYKSGNLVQDTTLQFRPLDKGAGYLGTERILARINSTKRLTEKGAKFTTFFEAIESFSYKTSEKCVTSKENVDFCPFKSSNQTCHQKPMTFKDLVNYVTKYYKPVPFLPADTYIYDVERVLLEGFHSLTDFQKTPSLKLSKLRPVNKPVKSGTIVCSPGEVVTVRADLVDGYGTPRTAGYDSLRAWMVETVRFHNVAVTKGNRAGAEITDLRNGSYQIDFRCLWPGSKSRLYVSVKYSREYIRTMLKSRIEGVYRQTAAIFSKGQITEVTPCFSTPNIAWPCLCNFTSWNNASFYCGRPRDPTLTCEHKHLVSTASLPSTPETTLRTDVEKKLLELGPHTQGETLIKQTLFLYANRQGTEGSEKPCRDVSAAETWLYPRPKGYFDSGLNWKSLLCKNRKMSNKNINRCLTNTTVWIFGDSNGMQMMYQVVKMMGPISCFNRGGGLWNTHSTCKNTKKNFTLLWEPHEYMKLGGLPIYKEGGVTFHLEKIPLIGRVIVIVHYYVHLSGAHISVSHNRLQMLKTAILKTLKRNPDVVFAFRGPHAISTEWAENHSMCGDVQVQIYFQIISGVFKDIMDKIIYLDGWDMTSAIENKDVHPHGAVPENMIRTLLSYVCD